MTQLHHLFVYGTLKRGQCREGCWPIAPQSVVPAIATGSLYDLGAYPAMTPGESLVAGELWSFPIDQIDEVRQTLDQIEGTNQPGSLNLYDRITIEVRLLDDSRVLAECYFYAWPDELKRYGLLIDPSRSFQSQELAIWPSDCAWP